MKLCIKKRHPLRQYDKVFYSLWTILTVTFFVFVQSELTYMYPVADFYYNLSNIIAVCFFGLILSTQRYEKSEIIIYLIIGVIFGISTILFRDSYIFITCALIISGTKINIEQFVRYDIKLKALIIIFIILLCKIGYLNNYTAVINGNYKQALGFSHPNTLSALFITVLLEWIYIRYKNFNIFDFLGIVICVYWIYSVAASRSSIYTFVFTFLVMILLKIFPQINHSRIIRKLFNLLTVLSAILSFILIELYHRSTAIGITLDKILTHRIRNAYLLLREYGISLFGQTILVKGTREVEETVASLWSVDMAYITLAVKYGIFFLILLCVGYYIANKKAIINGDYNLVIVLMFFSLFGIGETYIFRIQYNFTLVILLAYIRNNTPLLSKNKQKTNGHNIQY